MVKEDVIGRIEYLMAEKGLSKYKMASLAGINAANFNKQLDGKQTITERTLAKIANAVDANFDWLLAGEGKMLRQPEGCINQSLSNVRNAIVAAGDNMGNLTIGDTSTHKAEQYGYSIAPIVPREITRLPDLDVLDYIQGKDNVAQSPVIIKDVPVSMWYMVEDDALSPKFLTGDMVALLSTQKGMVNFVPGRVYAVDTNSRGILLRILFEQGKDLRTHSLNSEAHPDFIIKHNDVIRIYKVLAMYRFNN